MKEGKGLWLGAYGFMLDMSYDPFSVHLQLIHMKGWGICTVPQSTLQPLSSLKVDLLIYTPALRASLVPEAAWHVRLGGQSLTSRLWTSSAPTSIELIGEDGQRSSK